MVEPTFCKPASTLPKVEESEGEAESEQFPSVKGVPIR